MIEVVTTKRQMPRLPTFTFPHEPPALAWIGVIWPIGWGHVVMADKAAGCPEAGFLDKPRLDPRKRLHIDCRASDTWFASIISTGPVFFLSVLLGLGVSFP